MQHLIAFMCLVLVVDVAMAQQQPDPAKLLPIAIAQRDQANTQVLYCASQNNEYAERIKSLETELAKLKAAEATK